MNFSDHTEVASEGVVCHQAAVSHLDAEDLDHTMGMASIHQVMVGLRRWTTKIQDWEGFVFHTNIWSYTQFQLAGCVEGEELWVETEADGGKNYYYHSITRDTVWEKPLNAKVINQIELGELIQRLEEEERRHHDSKLYQ